MAESRARFVAGLEVDAPSALLRFASSDSVASHGGDVADLRRSIAEARLRELCPSLCDVSELGDPTLPDAYAGWR